MTKETYGLCVGGKGKLMLALPLLLADQNQKAGQEVLPIKTLSITGSANAQAFADKLAEGKGYPVKIWGYDKDGNNDDHMQTVNIVTGGFSADKSKGTIEEQIAPVIEDVKAGKVGYITSNTYRGFEKDYPPYLVALLKAGYDASPDAVAEPIPVFPMEQSPGNAVTLKKNVLALIGEDYTAEGRSESFKQWVERTHFASTSVDRITVDDKQNPLIPFAEPFAYIAIEKPKEGVTAPITEPFGKCKEIELVDDIKVPEKRKLGILNALHTAMTQKWIAGGREPSDMTVRQFMDQPGNSEWLESLRKELVAVLVREFPDKKENLEAFSHASIRRFINSRDHLLNEIATDHSNKIDQRLNLVLDWKRDHAPEIETPALDSLMAETISKRQLETAKKAAVAAAPEIHGLSAYLDEVMQVKNPQPQKGEKAVTLENLTTKPAMNVALVGLNGRLKQQMSRYDLNKVGAIMGAIRQNTGYMAGGLGYGSGG